MCYTLSGLSVTARDSKAIIGPPIEPNFSVDWRHPAKPEKK